MCIFWLTLWMFLSMGIVTRPIEQDQILYKEKIIYQVQIGDNLWSIAAKNISNDEDIRYVIDQIKKDNGIDDEYLRPGQEIVLYRTIFNRGN